MDFTDTVTLFNLSHEFGDFSPRLFKRIPLGGTINQVEELHFSRKFSAVVLSSFRELSRHALTKEITVFFWSILSKNRSKDFMAC